ncbi:hypothetical protein BOTBODRAFT_534043 [Botryobasidium botryosum FD-172 SS1]|uniref:SAM domain-containing protein n=1 Tax=Botryobasidium botryosum (strain FD-172 SS1) TaxID=930990 RepID=A0A067M3A2_BOTB1|nr:hypothetical protein BOTBODRAFT_534043 [Botryobasidium botryosum FD-172 SS1]
MNVPPGILEVSQSHFIARLLPVHALVKTRLGDDTDPANITMEDQTSIFTDRTSPTLRLRVWRQPVGLIEAPPAIAVVHVLPLMPSSVVAFGPPLPPAVIAAQMLFAELILAVRYCLRNLTMYKLLAPSPFLALLSLTLPKPETTPVKCSVSAEIDDEIAPPIALLSELEIVTIDASPGSDAAEVSVPSVTASLSFASATVPGIGEDIPLSWLVELVTLPTLASIKLEQIRIDTHKAMLHSTSGWLLYQCNSPRGHPALASMNWRQLVMLDDEQLIQRGVTDMKARRLMLRGFWGARQELGLPHPVGLILPPILDVRPFIGLISDLPSWLHAWFLHKWKEAFSGMEWPEFSAQTDADLRDRGIPEGARPKILRAIGEANEELLRLAATVPPLPASSVCVDLSLRPSAWLSSCADASDEFSSAPVVHEFPSRPPTPKVRRASFSGESRRDAIGTLSASSSAPNILSLAV